MCVWGGEVVCVCVWELCVFRRNKITVWFPLQDWIAALWSAWLLTLCVLFFFCFFSPKKSEMREDTEPRGGGVMRITMMEALYRQHHLIDQRSPEAGDKWATSPSPHYAHTLTPQLRRGAVDISNGWAFVLSAAAGVSDTCGGSWYERNEKGEMASQSHFFKKCFKRQKEQWQALITSELLSLLIWLYIFL